MAGEAWEQGAGRGTYAFCDLLRYRAGVSNTATPIVLRATEYWQPAMRGAAKENSFRRLYDVDFQSFTDFNRVFHKVVGQSPTFYRRCSTGRK